MRQRTRVYTSFGWEPIPESEGEDVVALCLSGGGMRAALFHLGALRRLNELGILAQVKTICSVSGGSIIAGFLAKKILELGGLPKSGNWQTEISDPFRLFVSRDYRTKLLAHGWRKGIKIWQRDLDRFLSGGILLKDLPDTPNFVFRATDLFVNHGFTFSKHYVGSEYRPPSEGPGKDRKLSEAIAASPCFPPLFSPVLFPYKGSLLELVDGGVRDNLGLDAVLGHGTIMASQAGLPFTTSGGGSVPRRILQKVPYLRYIPYMGRIQAVAGDQSAQTRERWLYNLIASKQRYGSLWSIGPREYTPGLTQMGGDRHRTADKRVYPYVAVMERIACIRTDLNHFTEAECSILENHGYGSTDYYLEEDRDRLPTSISNRLGSAVFTIPNPDWIWDMNVTPNKEDILRIDDRINRELEHSDRRVS